MEVITASGVLNLNKRNAYTKWLCGWIKGGGYTGWATLQDVWNTAKSAGKPNGCSWYAYGLLMAREQARGAAIAEKEIYG